MTAETTRALFESRLPELERQLQTYLRGYLADAADVKDVLQETLTQGFQALPQLRDPEKMQPWLRRIAQRCLARRWRETKRLQWKPLPESFAAAWRQDRDALVDSLHELIRVLASAGADSDSLEVLALHYGMEWTPAEIAAVTCRSPGTVYTQLRRARALMKRRRPESMLDPDLEIRLRLNVVYYLYQAGKPVHDHDGFVRHDLMRQCYLFLRTTAREFPDDPQVLLSRVALGCLLAADWRLPGDYQPSLARTIRDEENRRYDDELRAEAAAAYRKLKAMRPDRYLECVADGLHAEHGGDKPDWAGALAAFREAYRLHATADIAIHIGHLIQCVEGDAAALRYYREFDRNPEMTRNPSYHYAVAKLHFLARRWVPARRHLKRFRKLNRNRSMDAFIRRSIRDCSAQAAVDIA